MKRGLWLLGIAAALTTGAGDRRQDGQPEAAQNIIRVTLPDTRPESRPLELVRIPPGSFVMGCLADERGRVGREWPRHRVTLTKAFYLGRHEVTQGQWRAVMGANPAVGDGLGADHPVHHVSWVDCQRFIERLNTLGQGTFRMPTEAEWEYACRAGTITRFWFGDALACSDVREFCEDLDRHLWWGGNNGKGGYAQGCKAVGQKQPNPWGLYDMHGNVWEWCSDWWQTAEERGPQTNPVGPPLGTHKVMRGGAYESHALHLRSADRSPIPPENSEFGRLIGLRLVLEPR